MSLAVTTRPGEVCVAGPHRLIELGPLMRFARRLRVYGPPVGPGAAAAPSAWELDLGSARFTLTISPEPYRGFLVRARCWGCWPMRTPRRTRTCWRVAGLGSAD